VRGLVAVGVKPAEGHWGVMALVCLTLCGMICCTAVLGAAAAWLAGMVGRPAPS
jgi:hypothetical protein